jgi:hypothetical protein
MLISRLAPTAARLRRGGPLRAPVEDAEINRTGTESTPPHRCTSKLTLIRECRMQAQQCYSLLCVEREGSLLGLGGQRFI